MPTESSAVFRFIDLAQRQGNPILDTSQTQEPSAFGSSPEVPVGRGVRVERTQAVRLTSRGRTPVIVAGVVAVALISGAAGIYVGRTTDPVDVAPSVAAAEADPAAEAPVAPPPPVARVSASLPPSSAPAAPVVVAADAGFDLRVNPSGATVSLDGQPIGVAPLRVRNLTAGRHAIDIEAPSGYFSKHVEIDLQPGQTPALGFELEPIQEAEVAGDEPAPRGRAAARESRPVARADKPDKPDKARVKASAAADEAEAAVAGTGAVVDGEGTLMLGSKPPCDIVINGKKTGLTTPQTAIELPVGTHSVVLVNGELGVKKKLKVRIAKGQTTRVVQDLTEQLK